MNKTTSTPNPISTTIQPPTLLARALLGLSLLGLLAAPLHSQTMEQAKVTTQTASGTFEVKMVPQGEPDAGAGAQLARMALDKQFHGDLEAAGKGEMLTAVTETKGSAGYVAMERVSGTLHGRSGSFVFLHRGLMSATSQELSITVIPGSGSDGLTGLTGEFKIDVVDGEHRYEFAYSLPAVPDAE